MKNQIDKVITKSIDEINEFLIDDEKVKISSKTILFGDQSPLDSLKFFNLILNIEKNLSEEFNTEIILSDSDEEMYNGKNFYNIDSLRKFIIMKIKN
tara:strand:+ start:1053 stop:1343 length:291 start_codon:yes stop_codon:yes gene_type:complete